MRRALLLSCCVVVCVVSGADAASAIQIEAPAVGLTGTEYEVAVSGVAPYAGKVHLDVQRGPACDETEDYDWEYASGPFRETFRLNEAEPGLVLLCAHVSDRGQAGDAVIVDRAAAWVELRPARIELGLAAVHDVVGTDQEVRVRITGLSESEAMLWAWARPIDGAPCADVPWVGDTTHWGDAIGEVDRVEKLEAIAVPGTYRVCAQVLNRSFVPEGFTTIETQVTVSRACASARRSRTRRTASYRRARAAYRRARGVRRARTRRVMLRRKAAMNRARARVREDC